MLCEHPDWLCEKEADREGERERLEKECDKGNVRMSER